MYDLFVNLIGNVPNTYSGMLIFFGLMIVVCFTITSLLQLIYSLFTR